MNTTGSLVCFTRGEALKFLYLTFGDPLDSDSISEHLDNWADANYPAPKGAGRRPIGIERMLRIQFPQHWLELSDPA